MLLNYLPILAWVDNLFQKDKDADDWIRIVAMMILSLISIICFALIFLGSIKRYQSLLEQLLWQNMHIIWGALASLLIAFVITSLITIVAYSVAKKTKGQPMPIPGKMVFWLAVLLGVFTFYVDKPLTQQGIKTIGMERYAGVMPTENISTDKFDAELKSLQSELNGYLPGWRKTWGRDLVNGGMSYTPAWIKAGGATRRYQQAQGKYRDLTSRIQKLRDQRSLSVDSQQAAFQASFGQWQDRSLQVEAVATNTVWIYVLMLFVQFLQTSVDNFEASPPPFRGGGGKKSRNKNHNRPGPPPSRSPSENPFSSNGIDFSNGDGYMGMKNERRKPGFRTGGNDKTEQLSSPQIEQFQTAQFEQLSSSQIKQSKPAQKAEIEQSGTAQKATAQLLSLAPKLSSCAVEQLRSSKPQIEQPGTAQFEQLSSTQIEQSGTAQKPKFEQLSSSEIEQSGTAQKPKFEQLSSTQIEQSKPAQLPDNKGKKKTSLRMEKIRKAVEELGAGASVSAIAKKTGMARNTVSGYLSKDNIVLPSQKKHRNG